MADDQQLVTYLLVVLYLERIVAIDYLALNDVVAVAVVVDGVVVLIVVAAAAGVVVGVVAVVVVVVDGGNSVVVVVVDFDDDVVVVVGVAIHECMMVFVNLTVLIFLIKTIKK